MNVYLDSSIVLRKLQREPAAVGKWGQWERAYSSVLLRIEVLRTIDRNRLKGAITDENVAELITQAYAIFDVIEFVGLSRSILDRASESFLTPLGTLDALHLSTALRLADTAGTDLTFLTHDVELAIAARSVNLPVEGT